MICNHKFMAKYRGIFLKQTNYKEEEKRQHDCHFNVQPHFHCETEIQEPSQTNFQNFLPKLGRNIKTTLLQAL